MVETTADYSDRATHSWNTRACCFDSYYPPDESSLLLIYVKYYSMSIGKIWSGEFINESSAPVACRRSALYYAPRASARGLNRTVIDAKTSEAKFASTLNRLNYAEPVLPWFQW
jgi:hypothetical protein